MRRHAASRIAGHANFNSDESINIMQLPCLNGSYKTSIETSHSLSDVLSRNVYRVSIEIPTNPFQG